MSIVDMNSSLIYLSENGYKEINNLENKLSYIHTIEEENKRIIYKARDFLNDIDNESIKVTFTVKRVIFDRYSYNINIYDINNHITAMDIIAYGNSEDDAIENGTILYSKILELKDEKELAYA